MGGNITMHESSNKKLWTVPVSV